ncbi:hypothetical protein COCCADRAFT_109984, partial [Bipolaris zeicola 26-R-13]
IPSPPSHSNTSALLHIILHLNPVLTKRMLHSSTCHYHLRFFPSLPSQTTPLYQLPFLLSSYS